MTNGEPGEKGGLFKIEGKRKVNVPGDSLEQLEELKKEAEKSGIDLNIEVDPATGKATAQPDMTVVIKPGAKLPTEKPI